MAAGLRALCEARDVTFFDAASVVETAQTDGIHMNEQSHKTLGTAVAEFITSELQAD